MAADDAEMDLTEPDRRWRFWPMRRRWRVLAIAGFVILVAISIAWINRVEIADNFVAGQLDALGVPARYEIESIGPRRQVLRNLSFGNPYNPDLTIERVEVRIVPRFGVPAVSDVKLIKPRLFGSYRDGKLSFGSLDPLIFTESEEPFQMPDMRLAIEDGRALLESEFGPVGIKVQGKGRLRGGFAGELAGIAPQLSAQGCSLKSITLYGKLRVVAERPRFEGPMRIGGVSCADEGFRLARSDATVNLALDKALDGGQAELTVVSSELGFRSTTATGMGGTTLVTYRNGSLTAEYDVRADGVSASQIGAASLAIAGRVRARNGFDRLEVEGELSGEELAVGKELDALIAAAAKSSEGTFIAPVLTNVRGALAKHLPGSSLSASYLLRKTGAVNSVVVPRATVRSGIGPALLSVSRFQLREGNDQSSTISGNFTAGGQGMPSLSGRMEQQGHGPLMMRIEMPEYRAGTTRLALPLLLVTQADSGPIGFSGEARISGELPGGFAENLSIPVLGNWSERAGLSVWPKCTGIRFDKLQLAQLELLGSKLQLCPPRGRAIVSNGSGGLKVAAGVPGLDLTGRIGESPVRIGSGPIGVAWPGNLNAREIDVALGAEESASRFRIGDLAARFDSEIAGTFSGAEVQLGAVPLDVLATNGNWKFEDGALQIFDGTFRVEDREQTDRFEPLVARDATLSVHDSLVTAEALLREPISDREVLRTVIRHDLSSGTGDANLIVANLQFNGDLQPDTLTHYALGVIANAEGSVQGAGKIEWNQEEVTSSGKFTTDGLDFAAAFGPVQGVAGTVVFTDLLGLVTAPDQKLKIASINPGIEVFDGVLTFEMNPDYEVEIDGAKWPFLEGTLTLLPVRMQIGSEEALRYTLEIEGLDAARFVEQMDLGNLAATGTFDGTLPLVFDKDGGHIEGGLLRSRSPGGNVSYVGELTYKDLSAMANYAFDALRSLNYQQMTIGMDGALDGEIVTRVQFRGVSQGEGAKGNFITNFVSGQVSRLPIQFNVNVRAPFYQLVTSFKSLYDPAYVRDPRTLGLLDAAGQAIPRPKADASKLIPTQPPIQPPESEGM